MSGFRRVCVVVVGFAIASVVVGCSSTGANPTPTPAPSGGRVALPTDESSATVRHMLRVRPVLTAIAAVGSAGTPAGGNECWNVAPAQANDVPAPGSTRRTGLINECMTLRQATAPAAQQTALANLNCGSGFLDILGGFDDPARPLVTCDQAGKAKYLLGAALLDGSSITKAIAAADSNSPGRFVINVTFDSAAAKTWADFTAAHIGSQTAFVLDGEVLSAPTIDSAITSGATVISGNFTRTQAQQLANTLTGG